MKRILIGGCSFSEAKAIKWKSYTDFLAEEFGNEYEIINTGQSSFGQGKIAEKLLETLSDPKINFNVDLTIVQWSGIGRGYAMNEDEFIKRIFRQRESSFAPYMQEYLTDGHLHEHAVSTAATIVSKSLYKSSLTQMVYVKKLLDCYNIPYKMFWGWQQITEDIEKDNEHLLNLLYDEHFIRFGNHGGMSEYIISHLGEKEGILPNDFHPTTAGQKLFYQDIIKPIMEKI